MGISKKQIKSADKKPRGRPPKTRVITVTKSMDLLRKVEPLLLDGNISEHWRIFKQNFEYFYTAAELDKKPDAVQAAIFLNTVGPEAIEVFNTFSLTDAQRKSYKEIVSAFENFCQPKKNEAYASFKFHSRNQSPTEPFDSFLMEIKKLIRECNFENQESRMLRDRIILGVADKSLQKRLLETDGLDADKAISMARAAEASRQQSIQIQGRSTELEFNVNTLNRRSGASTSAVDADRADYDKRRNNRVRKGNMYQMSKDDLGKKFSQNSRQGRKIDYKGDINNNCKFCSGQHRRGKCPAWNKKCKNCGELNHFASACFKRKIKDIQLADNFESLFIDTVTKVCSIKNSNAWFQEVLINGQKVKFKLDTGAETNVVPYTLFKRLKSTKLNKTDIVLEVYGGMKLKPKGITKLTCEVNGKSVQQPFVVIDANSVPILGINACVILGLIQRVEAISINRGTFFQEYSDVFEGLGKFKTECKLKLKQDAKPVVRMCRRVPLSLLEPLRSEINKLCELKILEKVKGPTEWVSNLVVVEKKDKKLRLCLDPKYLNEAIIEEPFLIPSFEEISAKLVNKKWFTVLDLKNGYWQVPLDKQSSQLCSFSTPFGVYKFNRLPFGIKTAPEIFQKLNAEIFSDIPGVVVYIDDILISADTCEEHDHKLRLVMQRARENNVKFNKDKVQLRVQRVKYLGHIISAEGIKYDPVYLEAINKLKSPSNKKDLQKLYGMVNYLRDYIPNLAEISQPLRQLLKKNTIFQWLPLHDKCLSQIKEEIAKAPFLKPFDIKKDICIQADASQFGLGCCLMQEGQPICFASRSLNDAEVNYAQIEKEFLAVIFACEKFHKFIYGRHVTILTDHKPLLGLVQKDIGKIPSAKLQRMHLRLLKYNLNFKYLPGKRMLVADLLSRNYIEGNSKTEIEDLEGVVHSINLSDEKRKLFQSETAKDITLSELCKVIKDGWPRNKNALKSDVKFYWKHRNELSLEDGLVFMNNRVIVPLAMRSEVLKVLHSSHFGIEKTQARARGLLYWPGINTEIEEMIAKCSICQKHRRNKEKDPLLPHNIPPYPYFKIAMDIMDFERKAYLVVADYFSKYMDIVPIKNKSTQEIICKLKNIFSIHGIPRQIIADNVPFGSFQFRKFAKDLDTELITTSPRYPQSNGFAERNIQIAKSMLQKSIDSKVELWKILLEYRNTPVKGSLLSPVEILFNRKTRTLLPGKLTLFNNILHKNFQTVLQSSQNKNKFYYDRHAKSKEDSFKEGENVWCKSQNQKWVPAVILAKDKTPRSYWIKIVDGPTLRRNTRFLRHCRKDV